MILHIQSREKFTQPFIDYIEKNFSIKEHYFIVINKNTDQYDLNLDLNNVSEINSYNLKVFKLIYFMYKSNKIFLHGLNSKIILILLFMQPWLLKKVFFIMWGADLYSYLKEKRTISQKIIEMMRKTFFSKVGYFSYFVKEDYLLAKNWYNVKGKYIECIMYPSNTFKEFKLEEKEIKNTVVLIGNSADTSNNHYYIFDKLLQYKDCNLLIYCPLSYGDEKYALEVIKKGKELFGNNFMPLVEFIPFNSYLRILSQVDIAIFAHDRQQALGNIISLLGFGKKIYIKKNISTWAIFEEKKIKIFDIEEFNIENLDEEEIKNNKIKIKHFFSEMKLKEDLENVFNLEI